jgi:transaldolase
MSLQSLIASGTKVWLDSIDPELIKKNRALGATGATSNPIIVSELIKTGRFDNDLAAFMDKGLDDAAAAWALNDKLVADAQAQFASVWQSTKGDDGYVSFEVDPLLEDPAINMPHAQRVSNYIALAKKWGIGHKNRMIKVPSTPAGLEALEEIAAAGIALNVTLIFSDRQYIAARDAIWRGGQRRPGGTAGLKSVYSIFVSRVDVYTEKMVPQLSAAAQGLVGIVNAQRIWKMNNEFWAAKKLPLRQEMIFASTGTKKPTDAPDKYVAALAGADIQTNPPATNDAVEKLGKNYARMVDKFPPQAVVDEIGAKVDQKRMEDYLMEEGIKKFADPQHALLKLVGEKRAALAAAK